MWVGRVTPATVALLAGRRQSQWASGGCEWCCSRASTPSPPLPHTHTQTRKIAFTQKRCPFMSLSSQSSQLNLSLTNPHSTHALRHFFAGVQVWPWSFTKQTCPSTLNLSSARPRTDEMWDKKTYSQTFLDASLPVFARRLRVHIAINPHSIDLLRQGDWASSRSTGNSVSKMDLRMEAARRKHK